MKESFEFTVLIAGKKVTCCGRRSKKARHIRLKIRNENSIFITLPQNAHVQDAKKAVRHHHRWILTHLSRRENENRMPPYLLEDGGYLPLLDKKWRLLLVNTKRPKGYWEEAPFSLRIHMPNLDRTVVSPLVLEWYFHRAHLYLADRIPYWAGVMTVQPKSFRVKNQKTLWGSCSRQKNLNFNWRILLLPEETADYLIIHELAHLRHMDHSSRFWSDVARFCPHFRLHRRILKERDHWLRFPPS